MLLGASAAILTYHSLDTGGSVLSTAPQTFAEHMRILHDLDVRTVCLGDVGSVLQQPSARPLVVITFDDGFRNVYEFAMPVLSRHGFSATVFLVTDYCGQTNSWPGQPADIEQHALLEWGQIREMSEAGIEFGSHTRRHPDLTRLPDGAAEAEMVASKTAIEDVLGRGVDTFAYPYGAFNDRIRTLAARHFRAACGTRLGFLHRGADLLALERLDMYYLRPAALVRRVFSPAGRAYVGFRRFARDWRLGALEKLHRRRAGAAAGYYAE